MLLGFTLCSAGLQSWCSPVPAVTLYVIFNVTAGYGSLSSGGSRKCLCSVVSRQLHRCCFEVICCSSTAFVAGK